MGDGGGGGRCKRAAAMLQACGLAAEGTGPACPASHLGCVVGHDIGAHGVQIALDDVWQVVGARLGGGGGPHRPQHAWQLVKQTVRAAVGAHPHLGCRGRRGGRVRWGGESRVGWQLLSAALAGEL